MCLNLVFFLTHFFLLKTIIYLFRLISNNWMTGNGLISYVKDTKYWIKNDIAVEGVNLIIVYVINSVTFVILISFVDDKDRYSSPSKSRSVKDPVEDKGMDTKVVAHKRSSTVSEDEILNNNSSNHKKYRHEVGLEVDGNDVCSAAADIDRKHETGGMKIFGELDEVETNHVFVHISGMSVEDTREYTLPQFCFYILYQEWFKKFYPSCLLLFDQYEVAPLGLSPILVFGINNTICFANLSLEDIQTTNGNKIEFVFEVTLRNLVDYFEKYSACLFQRLLIGLSMRKHIYQRILLVLQPYDISSLDKVPIHHNKCDGRHYGQIDALVPRYSII
ncbi:hypothetical protein ACJX0J_033089, partial [Zea mays]